MQFQLIKPIKNYLICNALFKFKFYFIYCLFFKNRFYIDLLSYFIQSYNLFYFILPKRTYNKLFSFVYKNFFFNSKFIVFFDDNIFKLFNFNLKLYSSVNIAFVPFLKLIKQYFCSTGLNKFLINSKFYSDFFLIYFQRIDIFKLFVKSKLYFLQIYYYYLLFLLKQIFFNFFNFLYNFCRN